MKKIILILIGLFLFQGFSYSDNLDWESLDYWTNSKSVSVYIQQNRRRTIVKQCFRNWTKATDDNIKFVYNDFPKYANIEVEFTDRIPNGKLKNGEILGLTNLKYRTDGKVLKAKILIPYKTQNNIVLDDTTLEHVLTHEIGHALGLDHSSDSKSITYYSTNRSQRIQKDDISRLQKIYKW